MQIKSALLLMILCLAALATFGQAGRKLSGTVVDSAKTTLPGAAVMLISEKDTLRTVTDKEGFFSFSDLKGDNFDLRVAMVGYHERSAAIVFTEKEQHRQLGDFELKAANMMLKEVVIKGKPNPMRVMQDTIEFNADAFRVIEGDNMADLIKQMPGMEVDKEYNVTLMGKQMTKIRVNGKDFFTSDVREFVKQLPAGIASKIQVIDDYGDEANFTGIKIGEPRKILNIVTRDGINTGSFGNLNANTGTNDQAGAGGNVNLWNGIHQTSVQAHGNTQNNGAGNSNNLNLQLNHGDKLGKNGRGGIDYRYNRSGNAYSNDQAIESVYPEDKLTTDSHSEGDGNNSGHNLNGNYNFNNNKLFMNATFTGTINQTGNSGITRSSQYGLLRQDLDNSNRSENSSPSLNANFSVSKKMKSRLNSLTFRGSLFTNSNTGAQNIRTNTLYYDKQTGTLEKDSLLNRELASSTENLNFSVGMNYSLGFRPKKDSLARKSLNFSYNGLFGRRRSEVTTTVFDNLDQRPSIVDSLSTAFRSGTINHEIGINYNYNSKNIRYNAGLYAKPSFIENNDLKIDRRTALNTINYVPSMSLSKTFTSGKTISANYNGYSNNPTLQQLQPVRNTQNLQSVLVGNPNLKPAFTHNLGMNFNYVHTKSGISVQSGLNFSATERQIMESITLLPDTLGSFKQITQYDNVSGNYQLNSNYNLNIPLLWNKLSVNYSGSFGFSNQAVIYNGNKSFGKGMNYSQRLGGRVNLEKVSLNFNGGYNVMNNDEGNRLYGNMWPGQNIGIGQISAPGFFRTTSLSADLNGNLHLKNLYVYLNSNFHKNSSRRSGQQTEQGSMQQDLTKGSNIFINATGRLTVKKSYYVMLNTAKRINYGYALAGRNPLLINLTLEKAFLKEKSLSLSLSANDLLGQGNNVSRMVSGNTIIESRSAQQKRVFLLNLGYKLSRFGGKHYRVDEDY